MRYPKGSLQLSESRDLPLLRQILRSEFITHTQLFEFMRLNHCERARKSFDWRLRRLVDRQLVSRRATLNCTGEFVYFVGSNTGMLLQAGGEYCLIGRSRFTEKGAERGVLHSIGLNEIQLSALRRGLLVRWLSSVEVRSQNELTRFGYAKDYDAIVTIRCKKGEETFGLEYERSPKTARYYRDVAAALNRETNVHYVLYLAANYDLLQFVSGFFRHTRCRVFFGLVTDWHADLLNMPIFSGLEVGCCPFQEVFSEAHLNAEETRISR